MISSVCELCETTNLALSVKLTASQMFDDRHRLENLLRCKDCIFPVHSVIFLQIGTQCQATSNSLLLAQETTTDPDLR